MKKIVFNLDAQSDPRIILPPQPASRFVPDWYKKGERFINKEDGTLNIPDESFRSGGLKSCNPFLDSIIAGYIQELSCAIEITKNNGKDPIEFRYVEKNQNDEYVEVEHLNLIDERTGAIGHTIPRPHGHSHNHLVWVGHWGWKLPRGYSMIVTHPMNQFQLPFTTSSGFMESDRFIAGGNVPWYIKEGFTGIIPKGTPMYQIIPVKRKKWLGYVPRKVVSRKAQFLGLKAREVLYGFYRDNLWVKKHYEMD
jgi:hypothetical protein